MSLLRNSHLRERFLEAPVQEGSLAAVVFNILHRFENRSILGRGQKNIAFGLG